ncbi:MAG: transcription elongation factor GreAB [Zetaproteobacteria bacterium CG06_land_8_20_14_3_00_59_53]|nr:MAG: transcription elongation factor GreAB [Zetaproteobacteria bacterium CG2_30_59_37]PIO90114.1 MAG: transcription elongation factor GreAB [Zetaproteobacteria bacterium CG23_combo_of_CG06-09_8_20_14_all_59_86]PIQ64836.1 MAG: transcription elongation factor GreAB [Zetaproteobacteria bacterium CG11_big_fil_rev_8_21_14_0_20_59_439]PIU69515.1 MAG: transcription elongation factor GreAB [Zetaproteobacteria bacterium CG06_land_8_20_14_3_00_59_53]PIU96732.1 MAG: transcription elongation factor GreA
MNIDKQEILTLIIDRLRADLKVCEQAVAVARDTATHKDAQGSSRYETMGLEASYLAQGQGVRLLEVERALAWFSQQKLTEPGGIIRLCSLVSLLDEQGHEQLVWLAADAGGMKIEYGEHSITVITSKSPLGKALVGKHAGDSFEISIAGKQRCYEIGEAW